MSSSHVDNLVKALVHVPTSFGTFFSTQKKQLPSSQTKVLLHVKCLTALHSCWKTFRSFYAGSKALNKGSLEFSNNSRIIAAATSGSSIRGMSVNLLYLDEFAFVERAAEFYTSTYPVISAGKDTKVIVTSTANGIGNQFHKIWEGAVQQINEFKSFRVDWWDVPEQR